MESLVASYAPAPDQRQAQLSIHGLAIDHRHEYLLDSPQGSEDWALIHFHEPCPVLLRDGLREVPADHVVIWEPRQHSRYGIEGGSVRHSWLRCLSTALPGWLRDSGLQTRQAIPVRDPMAARAWLQLLHAELGSPARDLAVIAQLLQLFLRRLAACSEEAVSAGLLAARRHIESHCTRPASLAALARLAGMSRSHFAARYKTVFGEPPLAYAQRLRMGLAATLLRDGPYRIAEVAARCGYGDAFAFSKAFNRFHGCSPSAWRQRAS